MNRKQLTTLLIVGVVIGALGLFIKSRQNAGWTSGSSGLMGKELLGDFDVNQVAQIEITDADTTVQLKKTGDVWTVPARGGYPADFKKLGDFLIKLAELKVTQEPTIGPSQFGRLQLQKPSEAEDPEKAGTVLSLQDESGKELKSILLGKEQMRESAGAQFGGPASYPAGRYVMVSDREDKALVISDPLSDVSVDLGEWVNKDFVKVAKLKSVSVNPAGDNPNWTLSRATETGKFELDGGVGPDEQVATSKLSGYSYLLSSPSFNDIYVPDSEGADLMSSPTVASLDTFEGFQYRVKVGEPNTEGNYPVQVEVSADIPQTREPEEGETDEEKETKDAEFAEEKERLEEKLAKEKKVEGWTYLVSKYTIDKLLNQRSDLIEPKEEEEEATPAAGVTTDFGLGAEAGAGIPGLNLNLDPLAPPTPAEKQEIMQSAAEAAAESVTIEEEPTQVEDDAVGETGSESESENENTEVVEEASDGSEPAPEADSAGETNEGVDSDSTEVEVGEATAEETTPES